MTVDIMFQIVNYAIAKNLGQGNLNPGDFNNLATMSQFEYMVWLLGDFTQYQPGRPQARVQFGMNEQVRQRLTPFIAAVTPLTIDVNGFVIYPTDYIHGDAMYDSNMNPVRFVPQHKWSAFKNSRIDPVATNPIFKIEKTGFRFLPITIGTANISYVGKPPDIVWNSSPDANGIPVYTTVGSTDPAWSDLDMSEIIARVLRKCGVSLSNEEVNRYAQEVKIQGQ